MGRILLVAWLIGLVVIHTTPMWAFVGVKSDRLEIDGEVLGEAVSEEEMDSDRGRGSYMGFYFSYALELYWNRFDNNFNVNQSTNTNSNTNTTPSLDSSSFTSTGTQGITQAAISGINNTKGIYQFIQVPGSGNIVISNMSVNIKIIQMLGNQATRLWR
jgi:hypothetical protein